MVSEFMRIHNIGDAFLTFQRLHQLVNGCNMSNHDGHVRQFSFRMYICSGYSSFTSFHSHWLFVDR